jgi:molybdopterin converting factor small subunit
MNVRVKLFAVAKQRLGQAEIDVELPAAGQPKITIGHLRSAIVEQYPALAGVLAHARIAVDNEYAADSVVFAPTAQIAIIPPVSGG